MLEGADQMSDRSGVIVSRPGQVRHRLDAGRVAAVGRRPPSEQVVQDLAVMFGVLADPGRLRLLAAMLHSEEMRVGDVAAVTGQSVSAASHALRVLRMHRVVKVRRAGRTVCYRLADTRVRTLFDLAIEHIGPGDDADGGEHHDA
jgi:DNA-binding transcriptional ArsR family regulator